MHVEGPLEANPSPVYWSAKVYSAVKSSLNPSSISAHVPAHLYFTNNNQQKLFFEKLAPAIYLKYWEVFDTGFPYSNGGVIKKQIATLAKLASGRSLFGITFGNRFSGIFIKQTQ